MQSHALDDRVYIRSMATRGHLGGLAAAAPQALRVFDAAGFDTVLLETVGVGQSEIEVAATADTTLVLLAPGMGDGVQAAKAGILEIGDIFVVNKSDRDGSQALIRELRGMIALGERDPAAWKPPIVATVALDNHGIDELLADASSGFGPARSPMGRPTYAGSAGPAGRWRASRSAGCGRSSVWRAGRAWTSWRRRSVGASSIRTPPPISSWRGDAGTALTAWLTEGRRRVR